MTRKIMFIAVGAVLILLLMAHADAADTRDMEVVRNKEVLDDADLEIIDKFVGKAVDEILAAEDFSSISNVRSLIIANSASNEPGQEQFSQQFSRSAQKYISDTLQRAGQLASPGRRFKVITNLLMLINDLADPRLVAPALKYMDSDNDVISYWAVHCLTNPKLTDKLEIETARQIVSRLEAVAATSSPEILRLIASFAGSINIPEGDDLLFKIADKRIASYADWAVRNELIDADILKILADKMASSGTGRLAAGRRFGQLFSYVFQRYIKGADVLNQSQKEQLVSVLVEIERTSLPKLTGKPSFGIKRAIESGDFTGLREEHNNLLGDTTKEGQLPAKIGFDYGKDATGVAITHPLELASPPD